MEKTIIFVFVFIMFWFSGVFSAAAEKLSLYSNSETSVGVSWAPKLVISIKKQSQTQIAILCLSHENKITPIPCITGPTISPNNLLSAKNMYHYGKEEMGGFICKEEGAPASFFSDAAGRWYEAMIEENPSGTLPLLEIKSSSMSPANILLLLE